MESASQSRQADKAKPLVSIKDIAKEAGVSICTVSLVMNNKDRNRVSKAVAQRVRGTAQSMGYKPNFRGAHIAHQQVVCPRLYHR